jgi:hypothetical protein
MDLTVDPETREVVRVRRDKPRRASGLARRPQSAVK